MAIDKRLQVFDAEGNPVDYDILATDVKFNDGEDLPTKLAELEEEIGEGGYNPPEGGIPATDLAPAVQTSLGKADTAVQPGDLSAVATSGNYNDLSNKPTIPDVSGLATKTELNTGLADKVDKETGKSLMSDAEHTKLQNLPTNPVKSVTINGTTPTVDANGNVNLGTVVGTQGPKGDKGDTVVLDPEGLPQFDIVNDLTTGGESDALSAEMGKRLALKAGTYAGAWARSKVVIVPFCWLWQETVGGAAISKPIWHIGNSVFVDAAGGVVSVQAAAIPAAPTFSETSGSTVGKGTELTITPDTDSALYYKIDNGAWIISDIAVTIEINATCTITAKCVNNAGSSSDATCSLTVSGPAAPTFAAAQGTTIGTGNVVSRGGSIVVSVPQGGELHYSTDGTNYTTASGLSVTIPVPAAGVHIYAYNVQDNDQSAVVDHNYTMAALAAPSLSPANNTEFAAGGGTATITATEGDGIRYTTDGSDPRTSVTATVVNALTASVAVSSAVTIKACAFDDYGKSDLVQATYSVETAKLKVTASAATTMTLTKTDNSTVELNIAQDDNEFAIDTALGGVTTFASCAFGDKTLITKIDFGGITINNITELFRSCSALTECINLDINGAATSAFRDCPNLVNAKISGTITDASDIFHMSSLRNASGSVDLTGVVAITNLNQAFYSFCIDGTIDLSNAVVTNTRLNATFRGCKAKTFVIGSFDVPSSISGQLTNPFLSTLIRTIKCTALTPPTMEADWLAQFKSEGGANATILVPAAAETAYKTASGWSTYADIMTTY